VPAALTLSLPLVVIVPSRGYVTSIQLLRIAPERILLTPYVMSNDWWERQVAPVEISDRVASDGWARQPIDEWQCGRTGKTWTASSGP
jgi:hypothetical protein